MKILTLNDSIEVNVGEKWIVRIPGIEDGSLLDLEVLEITGKTIVFPVFSRYFGVIVKKDTLFVMLSLSKNLERIVIHAHNNA